MSKPKVYQPQSSQRNRFNPINMQKSYISLCSQIFNLKIILPVSHHGAQRKIVFPLYDMPFKVPSVVNSIFLVSYYPSLNSFPYDISLPQ